MNHEAANSVIEDLEQVDTLERLSGKDRKIFSRYLLEATEENPVVFFVGSCPDYSHRNNLYTHENLSDDVPLLTQTHLSSDLPLLRVLSDLSIPFEYRVMVADVEATDNFFVQKFAEGNEQDFLSKCYGSQIKTQELFNQEKLSSGKLVSTSFFQEFGRSNFLMVQDMYIQDLYTLQQDSDSSFRSRITTDTLTRMNMYREMYGGLKFETSTQRIEFYENRTIRTMAQYLALGYLMRQKSSLACVINHPTTNQGLYNDINRYSLTNPLSLPRIPIFITKTKVYE